MAAPMVSGIAALLKSRNPNMILTNVVDRIEETGYEWECHLQSRNIDMETARVDAYCALTGNEACYTEIDGGNCPE